MNRVLHPAPHLISTSFTRRVFPGNLLLLLLAVSSLTTLATMSCQCSLSSVALVSWVGLTTSSSKHLHTDCPGNHLLHYTHDDQGTYMYTRKRTQKAISYPHRPSTENTRKCKLTKNSKRHNVSLLADQSPDIAAELMLHIGGVVARGNPPQPSSIKNFALWKFSSKNTKSWAKNAAFWGNLRAKLKL